jgi:hypothetical protein
LAGQFPIWKLERPAKQQQQQQRALLGLFEIGGVVAFSMRQK